MIENAFIVAMVFLGPHAGADGCRPPQPILMCWPKSGCTNGDTTARNCEATTKIMGYEVVITWQLTQAERERLKETAVFLTGPEASQ